MAGTDNQGLGGLLDLSQVGNIMSQITNGANASLQAQKSVLDATAQETQVMQDVAGANQQLVAQAAIKAKRVNDLAAQATDMQNGGILGQMRLMGAQMLDPANFTPEGRSAQLDVINQSLQIGNMVVDAQANVSESRIKTITAKAAVDQFSAEAGMAKLRSQVEGISLITQGIGASENLRLAGLSQMSNDQVTMALQSPDLAVKGETMINGFKYTKTELLEVKKAKETRDLIASWPISVTDPNFMALKRNKHQLMLDTMSYDDLLKIRDNGQKMSDGFQVDSDQLDGAISRASAYNQNKVQAAIETGMAKQQLPQMLQSATQRIDRFSKTQHTQPGTMLYDALNQYRIALTAIDVSGAQKDQTGLGQITAAEAVAAATKNFDAAVTAEATNRAMGDPILTEIIRGQMYGEPVNPQQVNDYVVKRYTEGKPLMGIMPTRDTAELQAIIEQNFKAATAGAGTITDKLSRDEEKAIRAQAAQDGLQQFIDNRSGALVSGLANYGFTRKDNPLVIAGVSPDQYKQLALSAGQTAWMQVAQENGIDPANADSVLEALRSNDTAKLAAVGVSPGQAQAMAESRNQRAVMMEHDLLEQLQPNLGSDYAKWFAENGIDMAKESAQSVLIGNSYEPNPVGGLYSESVVDQANGAVSFWVNATNTATNRVQSVLREGYVQAKNPHNMFHTVMNMVPDLTPQQQADVYNKLLLPVLNQAADKGLEPDEVAQAVAAALDAGSPNDPALSKAAQRTLRALPAVLGSYNSVVSMLTDPESMKRAARGGLFNSMAQGNQPAGPPTQRQMDTAQVAFGLPFPGAAAMGLGGGAMMVAQAQDTRGMLETSGGLQAILQTIRERGLGG